MRFKNSYAAAVAAAVSAVVFSAAFQPAEAAPITIDNFNNIALSFSGTSTGSGSDLLNNNTTPSGNSGFDTRNLYSNFQQSGGSGRTPANFYASTSVNSGSNGLGVMTAGKDALVSGTPFNSFNTFTGFYWNNADNSTENLTDTGNLSLDKMVVVIAAASTSGTGATTPVPSINVTDVNGNQAFWTPPFAAGTYEGKFDTDFGYAPLVGFDWTQVTQVDYTWSRSDSGVGASDALAFQTSLSLDSITIVPEPTHLVFVAGIGATLGAWRLRKLRRSREAAGEAIAS